MRRILPTVLLCGVGFWGAVAAELPPAPADEAVRQVDADTRRIRFDAGESLLLVYPDWLTSVNSRDPAVIHVSAVRPDRLRVTRLGPGTATLHAVDRRDRRYSIELVVGGATGSHSEKR